MNQLGNTLSSAGNSIGGMLTHVSDLLFQGLTQLAKGAGLILEHLWIVLTKQQLLLGVQQLLTGFVMLIGSYITYRIFSKFTHDKKMNHVDRIALVSVTFVIMLFLAVQGVGMAIGSLPRIINPEYYALQESVQILNQVRNNGSVNLGQ